MKIEYMKCKLVRERECNYAPVQSPSAAADILLDLGLDEAAEEYVYLLCLNSRGEITAIHEVAHGSLSECAVSSRAVFMRALLSSAASVIIVHNHPSGDATASDFDIEVTEKLKKAGLLLDIPVIDHLIIASNKTWYSFKANGMI